MSVIETEPVVMSPEVRTFQQTARRVAPADPATPVAVAVEPVRVFHPSPAGLVLRPWFAVSMSSNAVWPAAAPTGNGTDTVATFVVIDELTPVRTIAMS